MNSPHLSPIVLPAGGHEPNIEQAAFLAPGAVLIGQVILGSGANVWYGCVLRADNSPINVGADVNIQDGCILHSDPGFPTTLGDRVSLGHGAIVHGAIVEDDVLIGMRATVLNGALIGRGSLVAAGAVVRPGTVVPPNSLVAGVPAIVRREISEEERKAIKRTSDTYLGHAAMHRSIVDEARLSRWD